MLASISRRFTFIGLLTAVSIGSALAQPTQPKLRVVSFYTVKADRLGDFNAATKEYVEALKKGGSERGMTLWQSLTGEREYALVRYHGSWAELDQQREPKLQPLAGEVSTITARIIACVETYRRVMYELDGDLSTLLPMGSEPQAMARVIRTWVRPEHVTAYRALYKAEVLPAAKKAGLKLFSVSHVRFGGSTSEFSSVIGLDKWAQLDGEAPMVTAMGGQAAYDKFLAKLRPLITRSEYVMYRYVKDSSYTPAMK
jgi:hypothetical protein